ncbi:MAG: hypothetical protein P9L89_06600 [Candidatus Celaenobacter polaris]|nr:hypothetical protein [Candidatus Celaenobacter polaris]
MPITLVQLKELLIRIKKHSSFDDPGMRESLRKIASTINDEEQIRYLL